MRWTKYMIVGFVGFLSCKSTRETYLLPYGLRYPTVASEQISIQTDSCCNRESLVNVLLQEGAYQVDIRSNQQLIQAAYAPMDTVKLKQLQAKLNQRCTHIQLVSRKWK